MIYYLDKIKIMFSIVQILTGKRTIFFAVVNKFDRFAADFRKQHFVDGTFRGERYQRGDT
jgi:hypothetical protein